MKEMGDGRPQTCLIYTDDELQQLNLNIQNKL